MKNGGTRNGRDPARTRSRILEAAITEFAHHGLAGARVDRIAERAGANKRMLYYYFGSKEDLFQAALEANYEKIRGAERELHLELDDPRGALKRLVQFTWSYCLKHPEFLALLNSENQYKGHHVGRSRRVRRLHGPLVETLGDILRRGERAGLFRRGIDPVQLYISIAAEGYFYLSNRYTLSSIFARDLMAPRALAVRERHITQTILNSVRR